MTGPLRPGRLDGIFVSIPDPQFLRHSCIRQKAVLASKIEDAQSSFSCLICCWPTTPDRDLIRPKAARASSVIRCWLQQHPTATAGIVEKIAIASPSARQLLLSLSQRFKHHRRAHPRCRHCALHPRCRHRRPCP
ncbi:MAG: hypothetical protein LBG65_03045 [Puniceicoccales bacterium]|nr:hypothetical protein [Puniceicoccales bacterium]